MHLSTKEQAQESASCGTMWRTAPASMSAFAMSVKPLAHAMCSAAETVAISRQHVYQRCIKYLFQQGHVVSS